MREKFESIKHMAVISKISDFHGFLSLQQEWNSLLKRSVSNSIFLSHEWFKCWWEAYGGESELFILVCKDEGRLIGISPLMMSKDRLRGFPVKKISFIENNESPHCGILIDRKTDFSGTLYNLFNYLTSYNNSWDILLLRRIPEDFNIVKYVGNFFKSRGFKFIIIPSQKSPILKIRSDWNTFYSEKHQRFKKKIRHDRNNLKKQGDFEIQTLDCPEKIEPHLEDIFNVGFQSWKGKIGKSIGGTAERRHFFSKLPKNLTNNRNGILIWALCLNSKMIAFEYHVKEGSAVYALRGEFDDAYSHLSPGSVLDFEIVRSLFENNYSIYNMGGGSDKYKLRWTSKTKTYFDIIVFNRNAYCNMLYILESKIRPIVKWLLKRTN